MSFTVLGSSQVATFEYLVNSAGGIVQEIGCDTGFLTGSLNSVPFVVEWSILAEPVCDVGITEINCDDPTIFDVLSAFAYTALHIQDLTNGWESNMSAPADYWRDQFTLPPKE